MLSIPFAGDYHWYKARKANYFFNKGNNSFLEVNFLASKFFKMSEVLKYEDRIDFQVDSIAPLNVSLHQMMPHRT